MNTPEVPRDEEKTPVNDVAFEKRAPFETALSLVNETDSLQPQTATPLTSECSLEFLQKTQVAGDVEEALVRLKAATLLEDLYEARDRLLDARQKFLRESTQAHRQLEKRSEIFVKSVESAQKLASLTPMTSANGSSETGTPSASSMELTHDTGAYAQFLQSAQASLRHAEDELDRRDRAAQEFFDLHVTEAEERIASQVQALLKGHAPAVTLSVQAVGAENAVAWLEKPTGDDGVLLFWLLNHHLPTHYDALFDDAVDDPTQEAPTFYAENGFQLRPATLDEADDLVRPKSRETTSSPFVPYKAHLPFRIEGLEFPRFRLVNQGPVLQLVARGKNASYEPLMPLEWAEMASGLFIQLQVAGAIELSFNA